MTTTIATVLFPEFLDCKRGKYQTLFNVFVKSAEQHSPDTPVVTLTKQEHEIKDVSSSHEAAANVLRNPLQRQSYVDNTWKMRLWNEFIAGREDGEHVLFLDCDMVVLQSLADFPAVLGEHDMMITTKESRFPFNSGCVGVRVSAKTRLFFQKWLEVNEEFLLDGTKHEVFRKEFGGINQAALGHLLKLESPALSDLKILKAPCVEWNCEDSAWANFSPTSTRILHVKSKLRQACLVPDLLSWDERRKLNPLVRLFRSYL